MLKKLVFLMILTVSFVIMAMPTYADCPAPTSSNGLVSWWKFENDVQDSIGSNNGIRYNFTDSFVSGKYGQALLFDSSQEQFIDVGNDSSLNFGIGDFSIEAWIRTDTQDTITIFYKGDAGGSINYLFEVAGQHAILDLMNMPDENYAESTTNVTDDAWHHLVGVRNSTDVMIYVDGILEDAETSDAIDIDNDLNATIGTIEYPYIIYSFNGTIDDIRIWNKSLSSDEISNLYHYDSLDDCGTVNYTALDANHTSYARCLNNNTLFTSDWESFAGIYYPRNHSEWCDSGCDSVTNSCMPLESSQNLIILVIIVLACIFGAWFIKWARRR